jgi:DNA-binding response OmpR family regulator
LGEGLGPALPVHPDGRVGTKGVSAMDGIVDRRVALVADDEPNVLDIVSRVLERHGWDVLRATDGHAAHLIGQDEGIDLLVTDVDMPGMTGFEVAESLRARRPDLPVVVVSGGSHAETAIERGYAFLAKPFSIGDLLAAVGMFHLGFGGARPDGDLDGSGVVEGETIRA